MGDGEEMQETANPDPNPDPSIVQSISAATAVAGLGVAARYAMRSTALSLSPFTALSLPSLASGAVAGLGGPAVAGLGVSVARLGVAAVAGLGVAAWNAMGSTASSSSPSPSDVSQEPTYHKKRTFRFNVDASQDPHGTNKAGIGGVLRNEKGEILRTFSESMELKDDINIAELTAIKRALEVFSENRFKWVGLYDELIVANDNEIAVRLAKDVLLYRETSVRLAKGEDQSLLLPLLHEIKTSVSAIGDVDFIKVDRNDIRDAYKLANLGRKKNF